MNEPYMRNVEAFYRDRLPPDARVETIDDPISLLTWNRLDIAIKLAWLTHKDLSTSAFSTLYAEHLRFFSLGTFVEPDNPAKNTLETYFDAFEAIKRSIGEQGFDPALSVIPLAVDGSILNGSHRVACAIHEGSNVAAVRVPIEPARYDWNFFHQRGMSPMLLDAAASQFIKFAERTYIALLWPRSASMHKEIAGKFERVIYKKTVWLGRNGIHNLLSVCYRNEPWLGSRSRNYPGIPGKLAEIYSDKEPLRVVAFQANTLDEVRELKERIRSSMNHGKHAIHITDSESETKSLSALLFNANGINFLNFGYPNRFSSMEAKLNAIREFAVTNAVPLERIIADSGMTLALYGLRPANDVDVLLDSRAGHSIEYLPGIESHDSELCFHGTSADDLVHNPNLHFTFDGIKFVSVSQVRAFKQRRLDTKDKTDLALISTIAEPNRITSSIVRARSMLYFRLSRLKASARRAAGTIARTLGMYESLTRLTRRRQK
jgi:hypothetical protein